MLNKGNILDETLEKIFAEDDNVVNKLKEKATMTDSDSDSADEILTE